MKKEKCKEIVNKLIDADMLLCGLVVNLVHVADKGFVHTVSLRTGARGVNFDELTNLYKLLPDFNLVVANNEISITKLI